jgi:ribonuclease HI
LIFSWLGIFNNYSSLFHHAAPVLSAAGDRGMMTKAATLPPPDGKPLKKVTIYTDGACLGNPGPGGYAAVLIHGDRRKEISGGFRLTTNNRMEIMAAIAALRALRTPCEVDLYTDSQYLVNAMAKHWVRRWRAQGWMRNRTEKAKNPDLWEQLLQLCARHQVRFHWLRGHDGHPENERCDELANQAALALDLPPDKGYEAEQKRWFPLTEVKK